MMDGIMEFFCDYIMPTFCVGVIAVLILCFCFWGWDEILWIRVNPIEWPGTLISVTHEGSTLQTHAVPVATGKGVGVGVVTTGHDEKFTTLWDLGKYGRKSVNNEHIFQYAKEKTTLLIKVRDKEVRIVGLVP